MAYMVLILISLPLRCNNCYKTLFHCERPLHQQSNNTNFKNNCYEKIVVVGGNFAGSTAALELKRKMKDKVQVTVIDRNEFFSIYLPDLGSHPSPGVE